MAGAVFGLVGHGRVRHLLTLRLAGGGGFHGGGADECGALAQVVGRQQAVPAAGRRGHKSGVGHVLRAVGKGQAGRLGVVVQPVGAGQAIGQRRRGAWALRQHAQNLPNGNGARAGRRKATHAQAALRRGVVVTQGLSHHRLVGLQVGQGQQAGVAGVATHLVDHRLRHRTPVKGIGALLRHGAQHLGEFGVFQHMAHRPGLALGIVKIGGGGGVLFERGLGLEQGVQPGADGKAGLGQGNGGLKQPRPRQAAVLLVGQVQHAQHTGCAHRAAAHHTGHERHGFAVGLQKELVGGGGRRGFAPIKRLGALAVEVHQKRATANAAGLRLHQRQHHLHRNRGVHR